MSEIPEALARALPCALVRSDRHGIILEVNDAACALLDREREAVCGEQISGIFEGENPLEPIVLETLIGTSDALELERALRGPDGAPIPVLLRAAVASVDGKTVDSVICSLLDLREKKRLEFELGHAQQLESVGRIAAGIAHEINTPVQFIGDSVTFLEEAFQDIQKLLDDHERLRTAAASAGFEPELVGNISSVANEVDLQFLEEEIPASLKRTLDGISRVAEITRAIKEFSYPDHEEKAAVDLNSALLTTMTVARNEYKYVADLETELNSLPAVFCHLGHLNQVFLNLIVNAAHAIAEAAGEEDQKGVIRVCTRAEGETVLITISDTGCGIPEGVGKQMFDAFFTTKEVGRGTGQGLAIARSVVVDKHFGTLSFESEVGKGTTFYIRLPVDGETRVQGGTSE